MSSQQPAGKAECPAEGLPDLRVFGLYGRRDCNTEGHVSDTTDFRLSSLDLVFALAECF